MYHARQKSVAGYKGRQGFFFIYKKNISDCMNSEVFAGWFGFMTLDGLCNLFLPWSLRLMKHPLYDRYLDNF